MTHGSSEADSEDGQSTPPSASEETPVPDTAPRAHTVILDWLEDELRGGRVRVGAKLPGERALAERFGISRASVREATRILDAMGLVRSSTGSGPTAGAVVVSEPSAALGWALRMHVATQALPVSDIVATRVLLETEAARFAASRHSDAALGDDPRRAAMAQAATLLERMDDPALPRDVFHELDAQFHITLAALSGNVVTETIMASLRQAVVGYVHEAVGALADWDAVRRRLQDEHRGILAAVDARDGELAAASLREHILGFYALATGDLAD